MQESNQALVKRAAAAMLAALTGLAGVSANLAAAGDEPQVGQPAPGFSATDSQGKSRRLEDFRGKTVVLEWTNADCPYTRKHYSSGNMQGLQELAREHGVVWLSVISSAPGKQGFVSGPEADALTQSRHADPTAVLLDPSGNLGRLYHAKTGRRPQVHGRHRQHRDRRHRRYKKCRALSQRGDAGGGRRQARRPPGDPALRLQRQILREPRAALVVQSSVLLAHRSRQLH
jgi:hypothetical protein